MAPGTEKLKGNRLSWYGHVIRRDKTHVTKRVMNISVERCRGRGRPKKICMDCVRHDMNEKAVNVQLTADRGEWRRKTFCVDPK